MIVTVEEVEQVTGIKGRSEQINGLIPLVEEWIKNYCNITEIPNSYKLNAIKMIEFNLNQKAGYTSESLSRHSVSFATEYPTTITKGLRRKLPW